jgi:hypothetical protein
MSGPITNYELGKSMHREYELQASRYWGQDLAGEGESILTKGRRLARAPSGVTAVVVLIARMLAF